MSPKQLQRLRYKFWSVVVLASIIAVSLTGFLWYNKGQNDAIDRLGDEIAALTVQVQINEDDAENNAAVAETLRGVVGALQEQIEDAGEEPVIADPPEDIGGEIEGGTALPTAQQVQEAVNTYCTLSGSCRGPRGLTGPSPTVAQVAAAVEAFCANDACRGPVGLPGEDGSDGVGMIGPQGPGPTDAQVAAAVAEFCANGACIGAQGETGATGAQGPIGETGAQGPQGEPGPGIINGTVCYTHTDGTVYRWRRRTVETLAGTEVFISCIADSG